MLQGRFRRGRAHHAHSKKPSTVENLGTLSDIFFRFVEASEKGWKPFFKPMEAIIPKRKADKLRGLLIT